MSNILDIAGRLEAMENESLQKPIAFALEAMLRRAVATSQTELVAELNKMQSKKAKVIYSDATYTVFSATMSYYYRPTKAARKYYGVEAGQRQYGVLWICGAA